MKEVINLAQDSKFGEFSAKIKQSLNDRLKNHPKFKDKANELEKMSSLLDKFKEINDEEPELEEPELEEPELEEPKLEELEEPKLEEPEE